MSQFYKTIVTIFVMLFGCAVTIWGFSDPQWSILYKDGMDFWVCLKPFIGIAMIVSALCFIIRRLYE
nr:MAG TPA: Lipopolysaccharide export system permease LptF/LptG [Caudoviricetes sp.]